MITLLEKRVKTLELEIKRLNSLVLFLYNLRLAGGISSSGFGYSYNYFRWRRKAEGKSNGLKHQGIQMDFDSYAEKIKYQIRQRSEEKQRIQNKFAEEWHKSSPERRKKILWTMSQNSKGFGCSYSLIARDVNIISLCDNPFVDHIPYRIRSIRVNLTELARVLWSASQYYSFDDFERIIDDKKEHVSMFLENVHSDDYARGSSLNQIGSITNGLERGGGSR